jgi:hypothetical protein
MQRQSSAGFWVELTLPVISALLTVLTMVWPDWIEGLFEVDPDAGSGSSEWGIALAFIAATVALAALTGRTWRRDGRGTGRCGSPRLRLSHGAENLP